MKLGAKIAKIRASLGETQEVFAKRFGKATSTIGGWEADLKVPRSKDLFKLAQLGNTTVEELMGIDAGTQFTIDDKPVDAETEQVIKDLTRRILDAEGEEKRTLLDILRSIAKKT